MERGLQELLRGVYPSPAAWDIEAATRP